MKFWTLFLLRITARAGLSVALVTWISSQWIDDIAATEFRPGGPVWVQVAITNALVSVSVNPGTTRWALFRIPRNGSTVVAPTVGLPGVRGWFQNTDCFFVTIDHWLLCLTLFLVTVGTHWRQEPKDDQPREATTTRLAA